MAARTPIEQRLEKARSQLARQSHANVLQAFIGTFDDMLARWEQMNTSQRRAVVGAVVRRIVVEPANPRKRWDPDRFKPDWVA
jgi:hypothetical protein